MEKKQLKDELEQLTVLLKDLKMETMEMKDTLRKIQEKQNDEGRERATSIDELKKENSILRIYLNMYFKRLENEKVEVHTFFNDMKQEIDSIKDTLKENVEKEEQKMIEIQELKQGCSQLRDALKENAEKEEQKMIEIQELKQECSQLRDDLNTHLKKFQEEQEKHKIILNELKEGYKQIGISMAKTKLNTSTSSNTGYAGASRTPAHVLGNAPACVSPREKTYRDMVQQKQACQIQGNPDDGFAQTGASIASRLRLMNESQRDIAENLINHVLHYAVDSKLTAHAYISLSTSSHRNEALDSSQVWREFQVDKQRGWNSQSKFQNYYPDHW